MPARTRGSAAPEKPQFQHSERWKSLVKDTAKTYGEDIIPASKVRPFSVTHTGFFALDLALNGGYPEGQPCMIYGHESCGKSTSTLIGIANYQKKHPDKICLFVDMEGKFDRGWADILGCDMSRLHIALPGDGAEAVNIIDEASQCSEVGLIVLDSIPACVPPVVMDKAAEDATVASSARLIGILCSKITGRKHTERRSGHEVTYFLINQYRNKIGVMFGDPRTLPGGYYLSHQVYTRIALRHKTNSTKDFLDNEVQNYNEIFFTIAKAKYGKAITDGSFLLSLNQEGVAVANPGAALSNQILTEFPYQQGECIEHFQIIRLAEKLGLVTGAGSSYKMPFITGKEDYRFSKKKEMVDYLREDEKANDKLKANLIAIFRMSKNLEPLPADKYLYGCKEFLSKNAMSELIGIAKAKPKPVRKKKGEKDDED